MIIPRKLLTALIANIALSVSASIITPQIEADFHQRVATLPEIDGLNIFNTELSEDRRECLTMLYAYMPLPDMTDRPAQFYIDHVVDPALKARNEMPWARTVPDELFRHFVLPLRVNNEALDCHRSHFYNELKPRIEGLSMADAILEINHWCHEKVTYQPSDGRTHSPLQSVSSAIGRCGEESTFTVAALRAMGIPARQVYTPRWAHTDDNHAWVEAWADGEWYFLGACEPEPVLNLGWFNDPAARGMLMHARVFGRYDGPEETLGTLAGNTDINVTANYAPVDTVTVTVTDLGGNPIENVSVSFRLYNYAELYPIATKASDAHGKARFIGGLGDIVVWVDNGDIYNYKKCSVGQEKDIRIILDAAIAPDSIAEFNLIPPVAVKSGIKIDKAMRAENDRRFASEDSIRAAYISTFSTASPILASARGNHSTISCFLSESADTAKAMDLLRNLTEKDLTDVTDSVLADHFNTPATESPLFARYVMSPRIAYEELTPFRSYLLKVIPDEMKSQFRANPQEWVKFVADSIVATASWYPAQVTMSPEAVWRYRLTSPASRDIFFVAGARTLGIPARIDPVTGKTQWADRSGKWIDANFSDTASLSEKMPGQGYLKLVYKPTSIVDDPKYFAHFTLSKISDGHPELLNYPDFEPLGKIFSSPQLLDSGSYLLISGQRLADGGVLAKLQTIKITSGQNVTDTLHIRHDDSSIQVLGSFDSESKYFDLKEHRTKSILSTTGRGYYVLGIINPGDEPSNHALRDIAAENIALEKTAIPILLLNPHEDETIQSNHDFVSQLSLPSTVEMGIDVDNAISRSIIESMKLSPEQLPIFIIADTFNRVVFVSQGYTIGIGRTLLSTLLRLAE